MKRSPQFLMNARRFLGANPRATTTNRVFKIAITMLALGALSACGAESDPDVESIGADFVPVDGPDVHIVGSDLGCISLLTPVGRMYVDNLLGDVDASVLAAQDSEGARYPVGTVITANPREVMVKRGRGFSTETNDWEFLLTDVDDSGATVIIDRGTTEVENIGGTCISCHARAEPRFDLICQDDHGCDDDPAIAALGAALSSTDKRCF